MNRMWKVLENHVELSVPSRLVVTREVVELPDGRIIPDYYKVRFHPFALILAESTEGRLICLETYRHGPARVVLALPGGHIEQGEDELSAARRELMEETGFAVEECEKVGTFVTLGNQSGGHCTVFFGRHARRIAEPDSDDLEDARVLLLSRQELRQSVMSGRFGCASDLAAIALLDVLNGEGVPSAT